jgi:hypothetical protein
MKGFKKCSNGHYYLEEFNTCPFCQGAGGSSASDGSNTPTVVADSDKTQPLGGFGNAPTDFGSTTHAIGTPKSPSNRTVFGDEVIREIEGGKQEVEIAYRSGRKLVGWLVTYSFDKLGVDYKLYEGRNEIGRDAACNITVPDKMMSGKHATILFKNEQYKIKDELSSHGTMVNEVDIEDAHHELHDGDVIQMGETCFKFKSSL